MLQRFEADGGADLAVLERERQQVLDAVDAWAGAHVGPEVRAPREEGAKIRVLLRLDLKRAELDHRVRQLECLDGVGDEVVDRGMHGGASRPTPAARPRPTDRRRGRSGG